MQSGGGPSRVGPAGRAASTSSAAASPSSSSSAVSTPHQLAFDSVQQQQQHHHHHQQQQSRQALQQQLLRKSEGNEAILAYQAGALQGVMGGNNYVSSPGSMQMASQQARKFFDMAQQQGSPLEGQNRAQGVEQQALNPVHQAYIQYAFQAAQQQSALAMQSQQQAKVGMLGQASAKDQDRMGNMKMQELVAMQAANHTQASSSNNPSDHFSREKQVEQGQHLGSEQRNQQKPTLPNAVGQPAQPQALRPMQSSQAQQNMASNQLVQLQAVQAWALERNIDLAHPANANLIAQLIPFMQPRMAAPPKPNESNAVTQPSPVPVSKQQVTSPSIASDNSPHANSSSDMSGQSGSAKTRHTVPSAPFGSTSNAVIVNSANNLAMPQPGFHGRESQVAPRQAAVPGNVMPPMHPPQSPANRSQSADQPLPVKNVTVGPETLQMQHLRQLNRASQSVGHPNDGSLSNHPPSQGGPAIQVAQQHTGFTKQQLHVLKAQILAFRRLKKGEGTLPQELLKAIAPPPLDLQLQQQFTRTGGSSQDRSCGKIAEDQAQHLESNEKDSQVRRSSNGQNVTKEEAFDRDEKTIMSTIHMQKAPAMMKEPAPMIATRKEEQKTGVFSVMSDQEAERNLQKLSIKSDPAVERGKAAQFPSSDGIPTRKPAQLQSPAPAPAPTQSQAPTPAPAPAPTQSQAHGRFQVHGQGQGQSQGQGQGLGQGQGQAQAQVQAQAQAQAQALAQAQTQPQSTTAPQSKDTGSARKYHGPLFDFPFFTRKHDSVGSAGIINTNNNLTLAYDVKDLLFEEGLEVLSKKRSENLKKINTLLAVNLERKRIRPDLVLRLQIEEKKLKLLNLQTRLRDEVDQQQQEIMAMPDRPYRKFVRLCERQRIELRRQVQASQKAMREKQLKSIFQWRKKLLEAHWVIRDARTARNRGVAKYHEKMLREFSKKKDDSRNRRMEALKNNDVERYREMLLEQQTNITGDAAERYTVLSSFLSQTEEYLHKLGSKITAAKNTQEVEEAANAAAAAARLQGLSEEEVRAAAACAGEEVMIRNRFTEMNAPRDSSSVNKYYHLAHAVNERVIRQPSMLRKGTLRDYQIVGLQWMLSLYNNKLNGILADEMGLGKTVQVMALIAYLMEFKGNYGPHLIIVPNAVLVNWKSELHSWLPSVSCIFYVGAKDQRSKLFSQEVCAMKFNVLVTTYEFIMYDRSKLSKVDWKYIIIDEAQRMKDRESVLARDLDRYRCQRRLLLTGTPLQNDLKELWSLLNLLLPEVFDNRKAFHDWFSKPFQKENTTHDAEDDWLETEKKVIIIHRLHQILEPFMLRRRVEDVEGSLPPKISFVLRCRMSAIQSAVYDWIKSTGTLRVDPEDEQRRVQKKPIYQAKVYRTLNNRCMELRKTCNHPLLNYPYFNDFSKDFLVKSCGKLWILDRILIKLQRTGHRVLLFSTMTKLLDILEEYLQWRRLVYRRIDGTTSLEDRESAIVDFNSPGSDCFIFLLSIRAAGRGLNLQSADTVIIYDPDPNPKNEEQAVARAHRIGQTREVKVLYMEAVVGKISSHQKEDETRSGGMVDLEDDLAGKDRYIASIEGLIRNNIQQYKIDMADEVINAGRFDQRTTHEERRMTLETLLHDDERYQETVHDVPSLQEVNRMIARSEDEVELFDQMDEELDWIEEMTRYDQVPKWLRASTKEVNATVANLSKKPSKNILFTSNTGVESGEMETERKRGRPKGKKSPNYKEIDDENGEYSDASSDERNGYSVHEEEGEIREFEDDDFNGAAPIIKDQSEDDGPVCDSGFEFPQPSESTRNNHVAEEACSSGSSSGNRRMARMVSPVSPRKFGSLSALDARPGSLSKTLMDDLEEGEIAVSGDSHMDHQQSGSWVHDRDEGEDEQVLQPKIKRKRSIRIRPRHIMEKAEEKSANEVHRAESCLLPFHVDHKFPVQSRTDTESKTLVDPIVLKHDQSDATKTRRNLPSRRAANTSKLHISPKSGRLNSQPTPAEDAVEHSRENWDGKVTNSSGNSVLGTKMSDVIQKKCKNVIFKFQRKLDKEGQQIVPLLTDLWKRIENSGFISGAGNNLLDLRKIEQRVERLEYSGVMDLVCDVQFMLKSAMQFFGFSHEVRTEARKVHDLFFDCLKKSFPDSDFREARNALSFFTPASTSSSAPATRQQASGQGKRQKPVIEVETDIGTTRKSMQRGSMPVCEDTRVRIPAAQKDARIGSGSGSSREHQQDDSPLHPGELVICKKKRKDRDKSVVKSRAASGGPVSPPSMGRSIVSPGRGSISKDGKMVQQNTHPQGWVNQPQPANGSGGSVAWANPVKRLRTDAGKRRPSHL